MAGPDETHQSRSKSAVPPRAVEAAVSSEVSNSYRDILWSSSLVAVASVIGVVLSIVRTKAAAVSVGPAGVGVVGIYTTLIATLATVAGLGVATVGTRQVAAAASTDDQRQLATARVALFGATTVLALAGGSVTWVLRVPIARWVLDDVAYADEVGWLGPALALTVAGTGQRAIQNGLRRIGDLSLTRLLGAAIGTVGAVLAIAWLADRGLVLFVTAEPFAAFVVGWVLLRRLPNAPLPERPRLLDVVSECRTLTRLGLAFMLAGLAAPAGQLVLRSVVQRSLGEHAVGFFQAATAVSVTYVGLVLTAMGADFYPRLTGIISDRKSVNELVNQQVDVALTLAAPLLVAFAGLAPWIIEVLYSQEFGPAVGLLRWQVLGNVLKVIAWPFGYFLLASGAAKTFLWTEWSGTVVLVLVTFAALPLLGLDGAGIGFVVTYAYYGVLVYVLTRRQTQFGLTKRNRRMLVAVLFTVGATCLLSFVSEAAAAVLGIVSSIGYTVHAAVHLSKLADLPGLAGKLARLAGRLGLR